MKVLAFCGNYRYEGGAGVRWSSLFLHRVRGASSPANSLDLLEPHSEHFLEPRPLPWCRVAGGFALGLQPAHAHPSPHWAQELG